MFRRFVMARKKSKKKNTEKKAENQKPEEILEETGHDPNTLIQEPLAEEETPVTEEVKEEASVEETVSDVAEEGKEEIPAEEAVVEEAVSDVTEEIIEEAPVEETAEETSIEVTTEETPEPVEETVEEAVEETPAEEPVEVPSRDKEDKEPKKKKRRSLFVWFLFLLLIGGLTAASIFAVRMYHDYLEGTPELDLSLLDQHSMVSEIYDRDGNLLTEYGTVENVRWVKLEDCPQRLLDAFICIEDERFYYHNGFDIKRLLSAVWGQLTKTSHHGASTITQQLIKNVYLTPEVSYKRKVQEIYLAYQLEQKLDKDQILEYYINKIYFGDLSYGVGAAAEDYFDKDVKELTLRECAMIAGVTNSPTYYNPRFAEDEEMSAANGRADTVLYTMYRNKKITEEEYEAALNEPLVIAPRKYAELYDYPYFIEYAIDNVASKMILEDGNEVNDETLKEKKEEIKNGGYKIYTTIDTAIQDELDKDIANYTNYPVSRDGSETQVSAVIIDQHTGEVVAMCGGRELPEERESFNRATMSYQPTGSSFKPISVYAPCLEEGYSPATVVQDKKEKIIGYGLTNGYPGGECYDRGVTMREALETSHNIPASRFLCEVLGIDNSMKYLLLNGFKEEDLSPTAAGLALGASCVTTLDMTAAYATLANSGVYIEPHGFLKVVDKDGNVVLDASDPDTIDTHRVFSDRTAYLIIDMMSTNMVRGLGVHARLSGMASAGKTGTHEDEIVDFGGCTPYYTSFIRMSTDNYTPFKNAWSYTQPTRLWKQYMTNIHNDKELENKPILDHTAREFGLYTLTVCRECGKRPLEGSGSATASDYFWEGSNVPTETCEGHWDEMDWEHWTEEDWARWAAEQGW